MDSGLGAMVIAVGLAALRLPRTMSKEMRGWAALSVINGMIAPLWLLSTAHYGQALFNPGGMTFFAMTLALAVYCRKRVKQV